MGILCKVRAYWFSVQDDYSTADRVECYTELRALPTARTRSDTGPVTNKNLIARWANSRKYQLCWFIRTDSVRRVPSCTKGWGLANRRDTVPE